VSAGDMGENSGDWSKRDENGVRADENRMRRDENICCNILFSRRWSQIAWSEKWPLRSWIQ